VKEIVKNKNPKDTMVAGFHSLTNCTSHCCTYIPNKGDSESISIPKLNLFIFVIFNWLYFFVYYNSIQI